MKKNLVKTAALVLTAALTAPVSCSKTAPAQKEALDAANPVPVAFYSYSLGYPTMKPGMEHLIREFNETIGKEKGVKVEGVVDDGYTKFRSDIAAGLPVDVVQHTFMLMDQSRVSLGFPAYDDIFPAAELKEHIKYISPNALKLGMIDGKIYGLAFTFSTPILYINGKIFEDSGLDPRSPPRTWTEVAACARQIKEKTGKDGFGLAPNNGWVTEGILYSNGAELLAPDRKSVKFASPQGIAAFQMWQDLYHSGAHAAGTDTELMEQFMAGNLGMQLQSTSLLSGYTNAAKAGGWELYGAEMPGFEGRPSVPVNSGSSLMVRPDSDSKSLAVWEFIKYVSGPRGYTIITSEIGYLPLRMDAVDDPRYLKSFVDGNPIIRTNLNQLERIHPVAIWPAAQAQELSALFMDMAAEGIMTRADLAALMTETQNRMNDL
ncbi:MAG: ABC transporter substrate-binding protein, partial [Treponema sp.]|nr:ABC transporter substrate-binding protein [Treponema sp.]